MLSINDISKLEREKGMWNGKVKIKLIIQQNTCAPKNSKKEPTKSNRINK